MIHRVDARGCSASSGALGPCRRRRHGAEEGDRDRVSIAQPTLVSTWGVRTNTSPPGSPGDFAATDGIMVSVSSGLALATVYTPPVGGHVRQAGSRLRTSNESADGPIVESVKQYQRKLF